MKGFYKTHCFSQEKQVACSLLEKFEDFEPINLLFKLSAVLIIFFPRSMDQQLVIILFLALLHFPVSSADTDAKDFAALNSLKSSWQNTPPDWEGTDPCGDRWEGIRCGKNHVIAITLSSVGLEGSLTGDIPSLSELRTLDLSYNKGLKGSLPSSIGSLRKLTDLILLGCSFSGVIPNEIGLLQSLVFLSLNSNYFSGNIPPTIGNLSNLYWLDLANNTLTGEIPVSSGSTPGLDLLTHTKHFHFGKNQLSGQIPAQLFDSSMHLIHVLFEGNKFTGRIPSTLGLVQTLEVIRLDRNSLTGPVPSNLNNLTSVGELHLSNNRLTGPIPNLTGMSQLNYVDLSNNSFDAADVPTWLLTLQSLTTLVMEFSGIQGQLPQTLFTFPQLQTVRLRNNHLNGTLDIGTDYSSQLQTIDLQHNLIDRFVAAGGGYTKVLILIGNPVCNEGGATEIYCTLPVQSAPSYSTAKQNCVPVTCPPDQTQSPKCECSYPYEGTLTFRAPSFSDFGNGTHYQVLEVALMKSFEANQVSVDSVALNNPIQNSDDYLEIHLDVFPAPAELRFNRSDISTIGFILSNQTFKPPHEFGPFFFIGLQYNFFSVFQEGSKSSVSKDVIIGAAAGGSIIALVVIGLGFYAFRQKKKAEQGVDQSNAFASWDQGKNSGSAPQLKGAKWFSFDDLKKSTNNFSEVAEIGTGGYGKVYRGVLSDGQIVAIKRAKQGSMQGGNEFKTEIELLSRVHHKNLVSLIGFCFENGEQMLLYEYFPNGSLKDSLSGNSGIRLDWKRRIRLALGAARGLAYLHELADPPIIHRDIKSSNILLDDRLNAKVSDFGLSKSMGKNGKDHVTTQVKGTMGYLDPEYYMTQQLTEKSDVYSFGVLLLEIITAKKPIERGRYIVREMRVTMDKKKDLYGLDVLLDPGIGLATTLGGFEKYVDLAISCVEESGEDRPTMSVVVKELENIAQLAGLNPFAGSASTSASYEMTSRGSSHKHPYGNEASFDYSGGYSPSKVEPK